MRHYYIVPKDVAEASIRLYADSHWLELPDGGVLLSARFNQTDAQNKFEQHATVEPLPSLFDPSPLDPKHVARLQHLGVKQSHTMSQARKTIRATHCLL